MQQKESNLLKKQLLEAKSQSAAYQTEVERLSQRLVELEAALITQIEENKSLKQTRSTLQQTFVLEKEALLADADKRLAEATSHIHRLELQEDNLKVVNDRAQKTIEALRLQLSDYQSKFTEMLSAQPHLEGLDIQGIFNHEYREKERLNEIILEQAKRLNTLQTTADGLRQENQRFREEFGVPTNFGHIVLGSDGANHLTRIEYLEREVEQLEEERAELRCKMRQLAAMVNPKEWDGDVFANLNLEQKELVCLYAINLLNGKNEVYLTDKSKELARENETLRIENEVLKRTTEGQQQTLLELTKTLKGEFSRRRQGDEAATGGDAQEKEPGTTVELPTDDPEELERRKEAKILRDLAQSWHATQPKGSVWWREGEGQTDVSVPEIDRLLSKLAEEVSLPEGETAGWNFKDTSPGAHSPSGRLTPEEILARLRLLKASLAEKKRLAEFTETQASHLHDLVQNSALSQSQHYHLLKDNAVVHQSNIKLGFENDTLKAKLDFELDRRTALNRLIDGLRETLVSRQLESQTQLANAVKTISHLNTQLAESVPLADYQQAQAELAAARQSNVELTSSLSLLAQLKPRHVSLLTEHSLLTEKTRGLQLREFQLTCEVRVLEELLAQTDSSYLLFRNLVSQIADKLKMDALVNEKSVVDRFDGPGLATLSLDQLNHLLDSVGLTLKRSDWELLTSFLLTDGSGRLLTFDLTRKLRLACGGLLADEADLHLQFLLKNLIEKTGFGVEELFGLFDSDSDGLVNCDNVMASLRVLGLVEGGSLREKIFFDSVFFRVSKRLDKEHFVAIFRGLLANRHLEEASDSQEMTPEIGLAHLLNQFLKDHAPLQADPHRLFVLIDIGKKGFFTFGDLESFFVEKLKVQIDKFGLEKLFSSIEKEGLSQQVTTADFKGFLKRAEEFRTVQTNVEGLRKSGRFGSNSKPYALARGSRDKTDPLPDTRQMMAEGEKKATEFALSQQKLLVSQLNEQLTMLEKELGEKDKVLSLYKEEVARAAEGAKAARKLVPAAAATPILAGTPDSGTQDQTDLKMAHELAHTRQQEIQRLRIQITLAEQEKLDMFKAATGIAAQHGLNLKEFVGLLEGRSREVLLLNSLREKDEELQRSTHKVDYLQSKWIEEKLGCQKLVEGLCEKLGMLQVEAAKTEANQLLVLEIGQLEHLAAQNRDLHSKLAECEGERGRVTRRAHQAEVDLEEVKIDLRYFMRRINAVGDNGAGSDNGLVKRFQDLLEEAKVAQLGKMRAEKELQLERSERQVSDLKTEQMTKLTRSLELEVEKVATQKQQREVFWSQNYQKLLNANAKISAELNDFSQKRKVDGPLEGQEGPGSGPNAPLANSRKPVVGYLNQLNDLPNDSAVQSPSQTILPSLTGPGVSADQLKRLMEHLHEPTHSKELLQGAESTLALLENLLVEKQEEISLLNRNIDTLKSENAKLRDQLADKTLQMKENLENQPLRSGLPFKNDSKLSADQKSSLMKPFEGQRRLEKQLRQEIEGLKQSEAKLTTELVKMRALNEELNVKMQSLADLEAKVANSQGERRCLEGLVEELEKKVGQLEAALKKKEREVSGLLETIKELKNELVGQAVPRMTAKQVGPDPEQQRAEMEARLRLTDKKLKEATKKLKETAEELAAQKSPDLKKTLPPPTTDFAKTKKRPIEIKPSK